jgi:hypothetical protein
MQTYTGSIMNQWEYVTLSLTWNGSGKGVTVTQFGESKHFSLSANKKFFKSNHIELFNQIVGKLGFACWELVSVTTIHGSDYHSSGDNYSTEAQSQECWFKRIVDGSLPKIDQTLESVFK